MPDLVYKIKAKDESESGFQSFARRVKAQRAEERASGEMALESQMRSPEGIMKMMGMGMEGFIATYAADKAAALTGALKNSMTEMRMGRKRFGEVVNDAMGELPLGMGAAWKTGANIREIITGEDAQAERDKETDRLENQFTASRAAMWKAMVLDRRKMQEQVYQTGDVLQFGRPSLMGQLHASNFAFTTAQEAYRNQKTKEYGDLLTPMRAQEHILGQGLGGWWDKITSMMPASSGVGFIKGSDDYAAQRAQLSTLKAQMAETAARTTADMKAHNDLATKLYNEQDAEMRASAARHGIDVGVGIAGKIAGMGTSDASRQLNYQIQMGQFAANTRRDLLASGRDTALLDQYMGLAMSPTQMALATGSGPGPLALPGASALPRGWTGLAANQQEEWNQKRGTMGDDATVTGILRQILQQLQGIWKSDQYNAANPGDN